MTKHNVRVTSIASDRYFLLDLGSLLKYCIKFFTVNIYSEIVPFQPLSRIHTLLVLATFASHCGSNDNLQTVIVTNSLAIQTLCEEGNIHAAELLQNECEEIISRLGEDCRAINRYVFSVAKSQLFLCKGLVRCDLVLSISMVLSLPRPQSLSKGERKTRKNSFNIPSCIARQ